MLHFYLRTLPSDKLRLTASVSKKVAKKAVERNLIKRRVRAVTQKFKELPAKFYIIVAKPGAEKIKGAALKNELAELLLKR